MMGLAGTAQAAARVASVVCLLGIPIAALVIPGNVQRFAVASILLGTAAGLYRQYLIVTYKATQKFDRLAGLQLVESGLAAVTLPLVAVGGLFGLAARFAAMHCVVTALTYLYRPIRQVGRFSWPSLKELMSIGIPLFASSYASSVAKTLPRLVLLSVGGIHWVGLFAPASALLSGFSMLPASLAIFFYPRMSRQLGATGDPRSIWPTVTRVTLVNIVFAVPSVAVALLLLPTLIRQFFPAYVAAIPSMVIISFVAFFLSSGITANALHSLKSWKWIAISGAARLVFFGALPLLGAKMFGTLEGIAAGVVAAFAGEFMVTLIAVHLATRQQPAKASP